jgi:peptidoglycan hydrolase CwlO-like protein
MSSTLFGRGTFLQTGNRNRQDQLDKQLAELRSFAVAATEEIRALQTKLAALENAQLQSAQVEERLSRAITAVRVQTSQLESAQKSAAPSAELSESELSVAAVPESTP